MIFENKSRLQFQNWCQLFCTKHLPRINRQIFHCWCLAMSRNTVRSRMGQSGARRRSDSISAGSASAGSWPAAELFFFLRPRNWIVPSYRPIQNNVVMHVSHAVVSCRFGGGAEPLQNHTVKGAGRTANQNYGLLYCVYHHHIRPL